jgi:multiple sugar transport system substrate-binding protein
MRSHTLDVDKFGCSVKRETVRLARFCGVFLLLLAVASVSVDAASVTLRWRTCCRQEDRVAMFQRWARAFEAENPGIAIDWYDPPGGLQQVKVEIAGGVGPDIMMHGTGIYTMLDVLMPLQPILKRHAELRREVIPSVLDQFTWQGEVYALPYGANAHALVYNKSLFDASGVGYPTADWTWNDALTAARLLTKDIAGRGTPDIWGLNLAGSVMSDMLLSFGGPVLDEDGRTVRVNNPVNAAALGFFSELMSKGLDAYPRPAPNALQQFLSGRVAMAGLGVFTVPNLRSTAEFSWDAELFPVFEVAGRRYRNAFTSAEGWAMLRTTKHPAEAELFLRFLMRPENLAELGRTGSVIPPFRGQPLRAFLSQPPPPANLTAFIGSLEQSQRLHILYPMASAWMTTASQLVSQALNATITVPAALEQIERVMNATVKEFHAR